MSTPPIAGPTIEAAWKLSWLSAIAAGSRSGGTRRGIDDDRAGWSIEPTPAATNATTKIASSGGAPLEREHDEGQAAGGQPELGHDQEAPPVDGVGERRRRRARRRGSG